MAFGYFPKHGNEVLSPLTVLDSPQEVPDWGSPSLQGVHKPQDSLTKNSIRFNAAPTRAGLAIKDDYRPCAQPMPVLPERFEVHLQIIVLLRHERSRSAPGQSRLELRAPHHAARGFFDNLTQACPHGEFEATRLIDLSGHAVELGSRAGLGCRERFEPLSPLGRIWGTHARVSTLLTRVGRFHSPCSAMRGPPLRGWGRFPIIELTWLSASPQIYLPPLRCTTMSKE